MNIHISRRDFVAKSLWGATASLTLPGFLQQTLFQLDARAQTLPSQGSEGPILLIFELAGGNDSLNTLVPFENADYLSARSTMRLNDTHGIHLLNKTAPSAYANGTPVNLAFHPKLAAFNALWQEGDLGVINGVGYPNPNLSHFTSFDYWRSGQSQGVIKDGWIGRYLDSQCNGCQATTGVEIAGSPTLAFKSSKGISPTVTFRNPNFFSWSDRASLGRETSQESLFRKLIGLDHAVDDGISDTNEALAYVQRSAHNAMISTANVQASMGELQHNWQTAPGNYVANNLKIIAQLIQGGSNTSIYYARQGGYDTHNNQILNGNPLSGRHFDLLSALNEALGAFVQEMKAQGNWNRIVILTFSEFGRKVIQNGSDGTDHGAAQTLFTMGGQVAGGDFYGLYPDLSAEARVERNSMRYTTDFRTVYRTLLENWMGVPPAAMGEIFPSQPDNFTPLTFV